ncbi:MAG: hypothetical protein IJR85_07275 [Synergistaceae bacterium]|nr:hypothetical protein [Synergistaceae bacterium]
MHMLAARCVKVAGGYQDSNFSFSGCLVIFGVCLAVGFVMSWMTGKRRIYLAG